MLFKSQIFEIETKVTKDSAAIKTEVTLLSCEISDELVTESLISGQSPRVRLQNRFRENGIPLTIEMSWSDFLNPKKVIRVVKEETPESILLRAQKDPEFRKLLLEKLAEENS
jgi:hypothetical protein